jgi:hypothetical protein
MTDSVGDDRGAAAAPRNLVLKKIYRGINFSCCGRLDTYRPTGLRTCGGGGGN